MKFLKNNLKVIIAFILGLILAGGIVYAAVTSASEVTYTTDKNGEIETVEDALNDLYNLKISEPTEIIKYESADKDNFISTYTATKKCLVVATSIAEHDVGGGTNAKSTTSQSSTGTLIAEYTFTREDAPAQIIQKIYKLSEGQTISCISSAYNYGFMKHLFIVY